MDDNEAVPLSLLRIMQDPEVQGRFSNFSSNEGKKMLPLLASNASWAKDKSRWVQDEDTKSGKIQPQNRKTQTNMLKQETRGSNRQSPGGRNRPEY